MTKGVFLCVAFAVLAGVAHAQITFGQTDTFTSGTLNWSGANVSWISGGGPGGPADAYLQLHSIGGSGPNSHMAGFNTLQWSGNYVAAGVAAIDVDFNETSGTELDMRLVLFDSVGSTQWESSSAAVLSSTGGWIHYTYLLDQADFTQVEGTTSFTDTLSNVSRFMFRHNPTVDASGVAIVATLGIDNVQAVPEPVSLAALSFGALMVIRRKRPSARRPS